jgi:hydroxyethylthiazole kinase
MQKHHAIAQQIKKAQPLVLNLTNMVTMDFVANCLLAIGATPIMCVGS